MMKKLQILLIKTTLFSERRGFGMKPSFVFSVALAFAAPLKAASENECAIWLCLPGGFPSGCGAAHSAMIDRVKDFKPPLPSFSSCAVNPLAGSAGHIQSQHGIAAFVPTQSICVDRECLEWQTVQAHYIKGTACHKSENGRATPNGCTLTYYWAEVFIDGQLAGPTYYWHKED